MADHGDVVVISSTDHFKATINEAKEAKKIVYLLLPSFFFFLFSFLSSSFSSESALKLEQVPV